MALIRRGGADDVHGRIVEGFAHVGHDLRFAALFLGHELGTALGNVLVDVDDVQHFGVGASGERIQMVAATPAATDDGDAELVVGAAGGSVVGREGRGDRTGRNSGSGGEHRIFQKLATTALQHGKCS